MRGLFVGLITLDLIYLVEKLPSPNQKVVAIDSTVAAGGPATNAAVAFAHLGHEAMVLGALGSHPITPLIRADLEPRGVTIADLDPSRSDSPPLSSIMVTQSTGERAVISLNTSRQQADPAQIPPKIWQGIDVVLIDGHQRSVGKTIAHAAKAQAIPIVIDAGSWKSGFEQVLSLADYAICSANFLPPHCQDAPAVFAYLQQLGIPHIVITHGERPIDYWSAGAIGSIPVPRVQAIDTTGAGDIFHGAFCHYILQQPFPSALSSAALIAAHACQSIGTRQWMQTEN